MGRDENYFSHESDPGLTLYIYMKWINAVIDILPLREPLCRNLGKMEFIPAPVALPLAPNDPILPLPAGPVFPPHRR